LIAEGSDASSREPVGSSRRVSSIVRSGERRQLEEDALVAAIGEQLEHWRERGDWQKLQCVELLFVRGWANKDVAVRLGLSEQAVANYKFEFLARLRSAVRRQHLPDEVFPELYEDRS
jgi:RNA polymerase sigma-70 factor (ECF subfamily)